MIAALSKGITQFLSNKNIILTEETEIYQYGFEMIISTIIGFFITILSGIILKMFLYSILFYFVFVLLRLFAGGYHAKSYLKCNITFFFVCFMTLGLSKIFYESSQYNVEHLIIFNVFNLLTINMFAPVENEYKPLSNKIKQKNRKISIILAAVITIISLLTYRFFKQLSIVLTISLFSIAILIAIEIVNKREVGNSE